MNANWLKIERIKCQDLRQFSKKWWYREYVIYGRSIRKLSEIWGLTIDSVRKELRLNKIPLCNKQRKVT